MPNIPSHRAVAITAAIALLASGPLTAQGSTQMASISSTGAPANERSGKPAITADAKWIAFASCASNLVPGDNNQECDVFLRNRLTGTVELISVNSSGMLSNGFSRSPSMSADGRYVAFASVASNLTTTDQNGQADMFVRDRLLGTTACVSLAPSGATGNGNSNAGRISADGSLVVFSTNANNLVAGDTNNRFDIFAYSLITGIIERVSISSTGAQGNGDSYFPSVSNDGRYVVFHGLASNLVPGDTNNARDVFVHDRTTGTTERVSVDSSGAQAAGQSEQSGISGDGRLVAFMSSAPDLVAGDTNNTRDVFVHDRSTGSTERVSVSSAGTEGTGTDTAQTPITAISDDGRWVSFSTALDGLVLDDSNGAIDTFVRDRITSTTTMVSRNSNGVPANGSSAPGDFGRPRVGIASSPPIVVFISRATNLFPNDNNAHNDLFSVDLGLRIESTGPASIGGAASVTLNASAYPSSIYLRCFSVGSNAGLFLPGFRHLPLDDSPLLLGTLTAAVTDTAGQGGWALPIPNQPQLVGLALHTTAVIFEPTLPTLFSTVSNVVDWTIQ